MGPLDAIATAAFLALVALVSFAAAAAATLVVIVLAKAARGLLARRRGGSGLGEAEIEAIPVCAHLAAGGAAAVEGERDVDCAVCLEDFLVGEELRRLPCGHCYHKGCIGVWLGEKPTCPKCLFPVAQVKAGLLCCCCC